MIETEQKEFVHKEIYWGPKRKQHALCFVLFCFSFWDSNKEIWSNFDFSEWAPKTAKVVETRQGYVGGAKECVN